MSTTHYHLTPVSSNQKTGEIPVTTTGAATCPPACPLRRTCYAKSGPLALHWTAVSAGDRGETLPGFLRTLDATLARTPAKVWRHNQAGDLPGKGDKIDEAALMAIAGVAGRYAHRTQGFTYTHKPVTGSPHATANLRAIRKAARAGLVINLSANNPGHADLLAQRTGLPVCVTVPVETPAVFYTPAGRKGVVCPAQTRPGVSCATCRLCSNPARPVLIGFRFHGSGAKHGLKESGQS